MLRILEHMDWSYWELTKRFLVREVMEDQSCPAEMGELFESYIGKTTVGCLQDWSGHFPPSLMECERICHETSCEKFIKTYPRKLKDVIA